MAEECILQAKNISKSFFGISIVKGFIIIFAVLMDMRTKRAGK